MGWRALLWSLVVLFPLPLVTVLNLQLTDVWTMRVPVSLGLVSYCWWLLAVLLAVRPHWLDRAIGLPSIYALHGVLGVAALVPAWLHRENTFAAQRLPRTLGDWAFYLALGLACYAVIFLSGWLTDRSALIRRARRHAETLLRHQATVWIHRLNLVVVALIWLHVHLLDQVNRHFAFMVIFDLYTLVVLGLYAWEKWVAPTGSASGVIKANEALNGSTQLLTVGLDIPAAGQRPGDYWFLRLEGLGRESHPFSITGDDRQLLAFTIRQTGDFTRSLSQVPVGTRVRLDGPFGRFGPIVAERSPDAPLVLIGMGAGIAPLLSVVAAHLGTHRIRLLWAIRRADDAYHGELINDYQRLSGGRLTATIQVGRFEGNQLAQILTPDEIDSAEYFIVGPNPAVLGTRRILRQLGVAPNRLHDERMTL